MSDAAVAYKYYRDGVKLEGSPWGATYALRGLSPSTTYDNLTVKSVTMSGVESDMSEPVSGTTVAAPDPNPVMSQEHKDAVDGIVAACPVTSGRTGVMVSVSSAEFGDYTKAYGTADGTSAMTTDMHFRIASTTKTFTAMAVLQAVDRGELSLDDTIDKFISWMPNGNLITIRMLLMMRSGLFNDQADQGLAVHFYQSPTGLWYPTSSLLVIRRGAIQASPDSVWAYTNTNFIILGLILQRITGKGFWDVVTDDIITPLGLTGTKYPVSSDNTIPAPYCHGYAVNPLPPILGGGAVTDYTFWNPNFFSAAGAVISTITDLVKWAEAIRDGLLLSPASHALWMSTFGPATYLAMQPPGITGPEVVGYGFGLFKMGKWIGHDGSLPGFSTACVFHKDNGAVITAMENAQTVGLTAWTKIMFGIAEHFYPGSAMEEFTGTWPQT